MQSPTEPSRAAAVAGHERIGRYLLHAPLGEGGMGIVYHAEDEHSGEQVALKLVRVTDEQLLESFRREIFALRSIEHPAVVQVVADGVTAGQPWFAMRLLAGRTLADYLDEAYGHGAQSTLAPVVTLGSRRRSPPTAEVATAETMPPPRVQPRGVELDWCLGMVQALCEPLAYVHGRGVVHRDLKPDNISIEPDGQPVLFDFGLALLCAGQQGREVLDVAGRALGTPPYMAPEQIRGELVDARADLYALGCILYELLTGQPPFVGSPAGVLNQHLRQAPEPPSLLVPGTPAALDQLVLHLLQKKPCERIGFAVDVARALEKLGAHRAPQRRHPAPRPYLYRPALAGREAVLGLLEPALFEVAPGEGVLVLVGGQSGVGKTRLVMELANAAVRRGQRVITGQCVEVGAAAREGRVAAAPLHPLRPLLAALADRCRSQGLEEAERLMGDEAAVLAPYHPALASLMKQLNAAPAPPLPLDAMRVRVIEALIAAVRRFTRTQPIFLVLDDLQWADELSLAFLDRMDGSFLESIDLRVIGTYRSEECGSALRALRSRPDVTAVEIGPLGRSAVASMVGDMLALRETPAPLVDFLMGESEGNPFFISEYLRVAIDERVLRRAPSGAWFVGRQSASLEALQAAVPLPGGLRELVRRRFAVLGTAAQQLVRMAAVLGRELDGAVLTSTGPAGEAAARAALEELRAREILEEAPGGDLRFVHDKLREIIYADIPVLARPSLHRRAAVALEAALPGSADAAAWYPALAEHFSVAGERVKAIDYLELAGEQALAAAASGEASRHFRRAIALAEHHEVVARAAVDTTRKAKWRRRLGEACYNLGEIGEAHEQLSACVRELRLEPGWVDRLPHGTTRELVSGAGAAVDQLRRLLGGRPRVAAGAADRERHREAALACERLAQTFFFQNRRNQAFAAALHCVHHAERLGPSPELARGYAELAVGLGYLRSRALVSRYGRLGEQVAEQTRDPHALAFVAYLRGLEAHGDGRHLVARRFLERAHAIASEHHDVRAAQESYAVLSHALCVAGERAESLRLAIELRAWAERTRNLQAVGWAYGLQATAHINAGDGPEALAALRAHEPLLDAVGDRVQRIVHGSIASAHALCDDWEAALSAARQTLALVGSEPPAAYQCFLGYQGICDALLGLLEQSGADSGSSGRLVGEAKQACGHLWRHARVFRLARPAALRNRGSWCWLADERGRAERYWRQAVDLSTALAMPDEQARASFELGRHGIDGAEGAREHLRRARSLWERSGARGWIERLAGAEAAARG